MEAMAADCMGLRSTLWEVRSCCSQSAFVTTKSTMSCMTYVHPAKAS